MNRIHKQQIIAMACTQIIIYFVSAFISWDLSLFTVMQGLSVSDRGDIVFAWVISTGMLYAVIFGFFVYPAMNGMRKL